MKKKRRDFTNKNKGTYRPRFEDYEQLKRQWIAEHPESTPEQYQNAMVIIAQRCGI